MTRFKIGDRVTVAGIKGAGTVREINPDDPYRNEDGWPVLAQRRGTTYDVVWDQDQPDPGTGKRTPEWAWRRGCHYRASDLKRDRHA